MKKRRRIKHPAVKIVGLVVLTVALTALGLLYSVRKGNKISLLGQLLTGSPSHLTNIREDLIPQATPLPPTPSPSPTPTPTPRPLTFQELNQLYGPCVVVPTLMYHHVQDLSIAESEGHKSLTVGTDIFRQQMLYLKDHGYSVIPASALIAFFDTGTPIPKKAVIITFDDGYADFGSDAAPILSEFGYPATVFLPTGLIQNSGYMGWSETIRISTTQSILMANHTWSHHNMGASRTVIEKEIGTADTQLTDHNLNVPKVFAYPYGITSAYSEAFLRTQGYKLAFTTQYGSTQCQKQRYLLPRIRIGNSPLSAYGL